MTSICFRALKSLFIAILLILISSNIASQPQPEKAGDNAAPPLVYPDYEKYGEEIGSGAEKAAENHESSIQTWRNILSAVLTFPKGKESASTLEAAREIL